MIKEINRDSTVTFNVIHDLYNFILNDWKWLYTLAVLDSETHDKIP